MATRHEGVTVEKEEATRATLLVVHVLTLAVPFLLGTYLSPRAVEGFQEQARLGAQKRLDTFVARAKRAGVSARGLIVKGEPCTDRLHFGQYGGVARV